MRLKSVPAGADARRTAADGDVVGGRRDDSLRAGSRRHAASGCTADHGSRRTAALRHLRRRRCDVAVGFCAMHDRPSFQLGAIAPFVVAPSFFRFDIFFDIRRKSFNLFFGQINLEVIFVLGGLSKPIWGER